MDFGKWEERVEEVYEGMNVIGERCRGGYIQIRKMFGYLGRMQIDLVGYLGRREVGLWVLFDEFEIGKIGGKGGESGVREFMGEFMDRYMDVFVQVL